jgi:hypothetical protein
MLLFGSFYVSYFVNEEVYGFFPDPFDGGLDRLKTLNDTIPQKLTPQNVKETTIQRDYVRV